jgi:surface polysaccharide O-acyltransferase-like enzyme
VLFAFNVLAAISLRFVPRWFDALGRLAGRLGDKPSRFALVFALACIVVYVPASHAVGGLSWFEWGPFTVQTARIGQYALYFLVGIAIGANGVERGLLAPQGLLAQRWKRWSNIAPIFFVVFVALLIAVFAALGKGQAPGVALVDATNTAFALTGVVTSFAVLAVFARFAGRWTGRAWASLDRNAFGIYLLHYALVSWLQYALLGAALPGYAKGLIVIVGALGLSWVASASLMRLPVVFRVIGDGGTPRATAKEAEPRVPASSGHAW